MTDIDREVAEVLAHAAAHRGKAETKAVGPGEDMHTMLAKVFARVEHQRRRDFERKTLVVRRFETS